ncbi:MAG: hypothetical protein HQ522_17125 [Bacteroidetes bacterium]|nr:hypothetical protein [Bacteroidota bacterium]
MPKTMFQNSVFLTTYQKILVLLVITATFVNCDINGGSEHDCIELSGNDCDILKAEGVDESFNFFKDTLWLNSDIYEEKLQACQIPSDILSEMCTYNLVTTCLVNYPFLLDLTVFNSQQDGFNRYKDAFNGIQELIRRCDGCLEIIEHYKKNSILIHPDSAFTTQSWLGVYHTEIFLAQPDIFSSLSNNERFDLFQLTMNVKLLKLNDDRHGLALADASNWILSRIMVFENYRPFINEMDTNSNLKHFNETMYPLNNYNQVDSLINLHGSNFIKSKK